MTSNIFTFSISTLRAALALVKQISGILICENQNLAYFFDNHYHDVDNDDSNQILLQAMKHAQGFQLVNFFPGNKLMVRSYITLKFCPLTG
jgi:hypothetical protein